LPGQSENWQECLRVIVTATGWRSPEVGRFVPISSGGSLQARSIRRRHPVLVNVHTVQAAAAFTDQRREVNGRDHKDRRGLAA
jgi:hypothetical protein